jgi:hypothetical protein
LYPKDDPARKLYKGLYWASMHSGSGYTSALNSIAAHVWFPWLAPKHGGAKGANLGDDMFALPMAKMRRDPAARAKFAAEYTKMAEAAGFEFISEWVPGFIGGYCGFNFVPCDRLHNGTWIRVLCPVLSPERAFPSFGWQRVVRDQPSTLAWAWAISELMVDVWRVVPGFGGFAERLLAKVAAELPPPTAKAKAAQAKFHAKQASHLRGGTGVQYRSTQETVLFYMARWESVGVSYPEVLRELEEAEIVLGSALVMPSVHALCVAYASGRLN